MAAMSEKGDPVTTARPLQSATPCADGAGVQYDPRLGRFVVRLEIAGPVESAELGEAGGLQAVADKLNGEETDGDVRFEVSADGRFLVLIRVLPSALAFTQEFAPRTPDG